MAIESINPTTEESMRVFEEHTDLEVDQRLVAGTAAFDRWRRTSFAERGRLFQVAAAYLRQHKERLARLITLEMGKPIAQAEAEVEKCAWNCEFYAEEAEGFLADRATV